MFLLLFKLRMITIVYAIGNKYDTLQNYNQFGDCPYYCYKTYNIPLNQMSNGSKLLGKIQ